MVVGRLMICFKLFFNCFCLVLEAAQYSYIITGGATLIINNSFGGVVR